VTYLLDTNIISAIAPSKKDRPSALVAWIDAASSGLYLSVVTVAEIRAGVAKAAREGSARKAEVLCAWWDAIEHLYANRILAFDLGAATIAGKFIDVAKAAGHAPGFADVVIAATAKAAGLAVLTRNTKHFDLFGEPALNPFDALPPLPGTAPVP